MRERDERRRGHRYGGALPIPDLRRHISFGGSSGSTASRQTGTTTATGCPLEQEEKDLLITQNKILEIELEQIRRQNESLAAIFPEAKDILAELTAQTRRVVDVFGRAVTQLGAGMEAEGAFKTESNAAALRIIRGEAPLLSQQEQQLIDNLFEIERQRGIADITRFSQEAAGARGLKLTDTPIGSEAIRGIREFSEGIGAEKARTSIAVGQQQQQFREAVRQFQEGLQFQAQQNRLALTGMSPFALQAPVSTLTPPQAGQTVASTLAPLLGRPVSTSTTQRGTSDFNTFNWGLNILGAYSTAKVKRDILPFDKDEYDKALEKLNATPITRWRYVWDPADRPQRTGVILEMAPEEIKEDANRLDLVSYAGMLHAGLRAVDRKVERVRLALPEARR